MKRFILLTIIYCLQISLVHAQKICGTVHQHQTNITQRHAAAVQAAAAFRASLKQNKTVQTGNGPEIHVPVVVHILNTGGAVGSIYNPSDADINGMIQTLNENFSNLTDNANVAGTFNSVDIPLRFDLAQRTPTCTPTTGIYRYDLSSNANYVANGAFRNAAGVADDVIFATYGWPSTDYYNMYIVNKIDGLDGTMGNFTAGFAITYSAPDKSAYTLGAQDGFLMLATQAVYGNSTIGHEIGHSWDLIHTFGGVAGPGFCEGTTGNCAADNDEVCDTDLTPYDFTCDPMGNNPCTNTAYASSTTQYNYMSYYGCLDRFTQGQKTRIMDLQNTYRPGFASSLGTEPLSASSGTLIPASCNPPTTTNATNNMGPIIVQFGDMIATGGAYSDNNQTVEDRTCNYEGVYYRDRTYPISISTMVNLQNVKVFIDYNNDGIFQTPAEEAYSDVPASTASVDAPHTGTITIPHTVTINTPIRMRVISDFKFSSTNTITPCGQLSYGQAEDYKVIVFGGPLSINYTHAYVIGDNEVNKIYWTTHCTTPLHNYVVEKLVDNNWVAIGAVEPANTTGENKYMLTDKYPVAGANTYRVKAVGYNSYVEYSNTFSIQRAFTNTISYYPNPVSNIWNVDYNNSGTCNYNITITNLSGSIVLQNNGQLLSGKSNVQVNVGNLPNGTYVASINMNNETKKTILVVAH